MTWLKGLLSLRDASRARPDRNESICMVSGGFDPVHSGHLALLRAAREHGRVLVALNSDAWLIRKKGFRFMCWGERADLLLELRCVNALIFAQGDDGTVCAALREQRPRYFANGGDRTQADPREDAVCRELGITQLFGIGGPKVQSSSALVNKSSPLTGRSECKARAGNIGANYPQDCNWPLCGCDPQADRVIAALEESGIIGQRQSR